MSINFGGFVKMLKFNLLIIAILLSFIPQILCSSNSSWYTFGIGNIDEKQYRNLFKQYNKNMSENRKKIMNMPRPLCIMSDCNNVEECDVGYCKFLKLDGYEFFDKLSSSIQNGEYNDAIDVVRNSLKIVEKLSKDRRSTISTDIRICAFAKLLFKPISSIVFNGISIFCDILSDLNRFSISNFNEVNNLIKFVYTDIFKCLFNCGHKKDDVISIIKYMYKHRYVENYEYDYTKHYMYRIIVNTLNISFDDIKQCSYSNCACVDEHCSDEYTYIYESEESGK